jgi:hypothetical protein
MAIISCLKVPTGLGFVSVHFGSLQQFSPSSFAIQPPAFAETILFFQFSP